MAGDASRMVFEQLRANASRDATVEPLLVARSFEVTLEPADRPDTTLEARAAGGLIVEPFGEWKYRIGATPARLGHPLA